MYDSLFMRCALQVGRGAACIQTASTQRLPEIEFGLRRGTTTNNYLVKASPSVWLGLEGSAWCTACEPCTAGHGVLALLHMVPSALCMNVG